MQGYVYAWKVPVDIKVDIDGDQRTFFLVKVGLSSDDQILIRLQTEKRAWDKLLARQRRPGGKFCHDNVLDIPHKSGKEALQALFSKGASWKALCNQHGSGLSDLCFLIHCSPNTGTTMRETEVLMRSVMGLPFPRETLESVIATYHKIPTERRQVSTKIEPSQVAPTEYCLVEQCTFSEMRDAFISVSKKTFPFGSLSKQDVLQLPVLRIPSAMHLCSVDVSPVLRLPRSHVVPHVLVRATMKDTRPEKDESGIIFCLVEWPRETIADAFLEACKTDQRRAFCKKNGICASDLRMYLDYDGNPEFSHPKVEAAVGRFIDALAFTDERNK